MACFQRCSLCCLLHHTAPSRPAPGLRRACRTSLGSWPSCRTPAHDGRIIISELLLARAGGRRHTPQDMDLLLGDTVCLTCCLLGHPRQRLTCSTELTGTAASGDDRHSTCCSRPSSLPRSPGLTASCCRAASCWLAPLPHPPTPPAAPLPSACCCWPSGSGPVTAASCACRICANTWMGGCGVDDSKGVCFPLAAMGRHGKHQSGEVQGLCAHGPVLDA